MRSVESPARPTTRTVHAGFQQGDGCGGKWEYVEVLGKWDEGIMQKVAADAIAVHGHFAGAYVQDGTPGLVQALIDTKHGFIPVAGQAENGFKKMCVKYQDQGPNLRFGRSGSKSRGHRPQGRHQRRQGQRDAAVHLGTDTL